MTIFDEEDPLGLIKTLKSEVLVKGEDWREKEIVGADVVKRNGGKVIRAKMIPDASTSRIIQGIVERYQKI